MALKKHSWTIKDDMAYKLLDKCAFLHHSTRIPIDIRIFFHITDMANQERKEVFMIYQDQEYKASISFLDNRTTLFWNYDFSKVLKNAYPGFFTAYSAGDNPPNDDTPIIIFSKDSDINRYFVSFAPDYFNTTLSNKLSTHYLELLAKHSRKNPLTRQTITNTYERSPIIAEYAKRRANGFCQLCDSPAPFKDKDGNPFLETHHIVWLSEGGEDTVENTTALCPNCHRKMHILNLKEDRNKLINIAFRTLL